MQSDDFKGDFYGKFVSSPMFELKDLKLNSFIPKIIPRHPNTPTIRKDIQRKLRKTVNDTLQMKERHGRSASLSSIPSCGQSMSAKLARKVTLSDTTYPDSNSVPSSDKICHFSQSERLHLMESAREENKNQRFIENVSLADVYCKQSVSTISVSPFVKLAYPDIVNCSSDKKFEAQLLKPDPFLIR